MGHQPFGWFVLHRAGMQARANPLIEFSAESLLEVTPQHWFRVLEGGLGLLTVHVANGHRPAAAWSGINVAQQARPMAIDVSQYADFGASAADI
jgi:hypothetical protein